MDDDGNATSNGGMATAMNSAAGNAKLGVPNAVDTGDVTVGLTIEAGMYTIQPGETVWMLAMPPLHVPQGVRTL